MMMSAFTIPLMHGHPEPLLDLYPAMVEVYDKAPKPTGLEFELFCDMAFRICKSKRIPGAERAGLDWPYIEQLFSRVFAWTLQRYRLPQIADPDVVKMRPFVELLAQDGCCPMAAAKRGLRLNDGKLQERLPLEGCWQKCQCQYTTRSYRDLQREGRA